jgi:hypothetical protein
MTHKRGLGRVGVQRNGRDQFLRQEGGGKTTLKFRRNKIHRSQEKERVQRTIIVKRRAWQGPGMLRNTMLAGTPGSQGSETPVAPWR